MPWHFRVWCERNQRVILIMIVVVEPHNAEKHADLLEQMFRMRARIFRDHLGWDVVVDDGKECDRYDEQSPVYIIYTDDGGRTVKGSLRLLPTTGPTQVADFFSDTLPDAASLMAPSIWECTRFCLDENIWQKNKEEIVFASTVLLVALGDLALRVGNRVDHRKFRCRGAPPLAAHRLRSRDPRIDIKVRPPGLSRPASHFRDDHRSDKEKTERGPISLRRGTGHGCLG